MSRYWKELALKYYEKARILKKEGSIVTLELIPKEDAAVVWGKVIKWISKKEHWQLKTEYFDEDNELVRTELASEIKQFSDRKLPSKLEIIPASKPGQKTEVIVKSAKFNIKLDDGFFSQQNMKRVR